MKETAETVGTAKEQEPSPKTTGLHVRLSWFASISNDLRDPWHQPGGMPSTSGRMRSLSPSKGVLRFKPHTPRKQQTPLSGKRWSATGKTDWGVVGGESK
jgi:hypothetical protein